MRNPLPLFALAALLCGCVSPSGWKHESFAFATPAPSPTNGASTNAIALGRVTVSPLFQGRAFTYRTGPDAYEQDPYAGFLIAPDRALAEPIRAWLRSSGAFGRVIEPGSALPASTLLEASIDELYGDFTAPGRLSAVMRIHFVLYSNGGEGPGPVILDRAFSHDALLKNKTPAALMAAWDDDLHAIMDQLAAAISSGSN